MHDAMISVEKFHRKHQFNVDLHLSKESHNPSVTLELQTMSEAVAEFGEILESICKITYDSRLMRAHLVLEEVAELISALAQGNELELLDGMADAIYVIIGTAVTYDLPLAEAFEEICHSNMTKKKRKPGDQRLRDKGNWEPPNLKEVLACHKARKRNTSP